MNLGNMPVVCGVLDLQNPTENLKIQIFIDSQGFTGIDDFTMLHIKDALHMINDHNLVPNKESCLGAIQKHKLQALVWWTENHHNLVLAMTTTAWTAAYLTSSITQINIESPLVG